MSARTREESWRLGAAEIAALLAGSHGDPFAVLGPHLAGKDWIARAVIPGADTVEAATLAGEALGKLERRNGDGFSKESLRSTGYSPSATRRATPVEPGR